MATDEQGEPDVRQPDYRLRAMIKGTGEKALVGAGWIKADGSIGLKLDPFIVLIGSADLVLTLFPEDAKTELPNDAPLCPKCNKPMVLRKGKTTFWGCKSYPRCQGMRAI